MTRILVIDDDPQVLDILAEMLTDAGYEVQKAINGTEGVRLFRQSAFDLVLTDLLMPEKDGLEVVMELRKDFPQVKIITLSGGDTYGNFHDSRLHSVRFCWTDDICFKEVVRAAVLDRVKKLSNPLQGFESTDRSSLASSNL